MLLTLISLSIFLCYIVSMITIFGIPASISDTYYLLENKRKGLGWMFTAMCVGVGGLLLPALLYITPDTFQFTSFLACGSLLFVGVASQFKTPLTRQVHYGAAAICVLFSQLWVAMTYWWVLVPIWLAFVGYIFLKKEKRNIIFWAEICALTSTYIAVFYRIICLF